MNQTSEAAGHLDGLVENEIIGWASYGPEDARSPELELLVDGQVIVTIEGCLPRPGVMKRGLHPTGHCGFAFDLELIPEPLRHDPRVISVRLIHDGGLERTELRNSPTAVVWDTSLHVPAVKKLFFMHIAKAAGTSANHMMASFYSPQACVTHIETQFSDWPKDHARQFDFVSGHIEAPIAQKLGLKDYVWVTLFRRPRPHLFSHINWLRHIGSEPDSDFHRVHSPAVQELSLRLTEVAPGDEAALGRILDYDNPIVRTLFDNRQTRYLLPRNTDRVGDAELAQARENLRWFDLVGTLEQIDKFNKALPPLIGAKETVELPSLNRRQAVTPLNYDDFSVDLVLPFIRYDREIYWEAQRIVRHQAGRQQTGRAHALARQPKPQYGLSPRQTSVEQATHPGRQPCTELVPAQDTPEKTLVVLGVSRGGTSMIAGLLQLFGVYMGQKLSPGSHEDVEFHSHDTGALRQLIDKRNAEHALWGWKYPHTLDYLGKVRRRLRNPHFVVVYRDVLSVAQAFHRHDGTDMHTALRDAQRRYSALSRFADRCKEPLLCVSYEKAIANPDALIRGLAGFCGTDLSMQQKAECIQFINPGRYTPLGGPRR